MKERGPLKDLASLAAIASALALLWQTRPPLAELPHVLTASPAVLPIVYALVWCAVALLLLLGLVRALRARLHRQTSAQAAGSPRWLLADRPRRRLATGPMALWPSPGGPVPQLSIRAPAPVDGGPAPAEPTTTNAGDRTVSAPAHAAPRPPEPAAGLDADVGEAAKPLVSVLGPLTISGGKRQRRGLRAAAVELIAYLSLRPQGASRDELLEAFWPGDDPLRSRERLYQATRDARRLLGATLANEHDRYRLDRTHVRVDADELDKLLAETERGANEQARAELLERALALFRGEPLAGSDYRWAEGDLRRLRANYVDLLERVSRTRLARGDARGTLELAERALVLDQLNETFWRLALEAEGALGLREAVSSRYEQLRRLLNERLGLTPNRETKALYRRLLSQA